ncbi:hypothetical protein ELQ92_14250 [Labedella populi]|uniref:Uncharacterized protein n=1 Tax=Labedella populi TaxID=2498850 RepID=A0A3S4DXH8_9MICO|nr:hypothetical protein [Labedella populi]RWZ58463.1 hypothetical protein ELQ92_14250 [Labedella populi]
MTFGARGAQIDRFVGWLRGLEVGDLQRVVAVIPVPRPAHIKDAQRTLDSVKVSAAQNQSLNKALRDLWAESGARDAFDDAGLFLRLATNTSMAGQAILVRDRLAPETFDLIVRPFRDAGFDFDQEA